MSTFRKDILHQLQQLKGSGKFASVNTTSFIMPGLKVDGLGEISFPLNERQAKDLIQLAGKAPFGLGTETVYDDKVRSVREIDADKITIDNPAWDKFLSEATVNIEEDLGLEDYNVSAHLFKLLIYQEGDFFLPHKDTEKEKGMFGTMVVGLPAHYTGGELVIQFEGEKIISDFSDSKTGYELNYTAFYADCDHEVKPLKSGYRICLVYNLVQDTRRERIELLSMEKYVNNVARLINNQTQQLKTKPLIFLLEHQYTPENFSYQTLKLNDRYKAEVLLQAAEKIDCYAKLCLVTSYLMGQPAYDGYSEYGEDAGDDDTEMKEVLDNDLYIKYWDKRGVPKIDRVPFEEQDLISSFSRDEYEPIIKESTGYMGNYGPDIEHWYHFGAVIVWSKDVNAAFLKEASKATQLEWMAYFNTQGQVSRTEDEAVRFILSNDENPQRNGEVQNYNAIADWIIAHNDIALFNDLDDEKLRAYFLKISEDKWVSLFELLGNERTIKIIEKVTNKSPITYLEKLLSLLKVMFPVKELENPALGIVEKLPDMLHAVYSQSKRQINTKGLADLFWIESHSHPSVQWIQEFYKVLTLQENRTYVHNVWTPFLLYMDKQTILSKQLFNYWLYYIKKRVDNKPKPPKDWSRSLPKTKREEAEWDFYHRSKEQDKEVWNMLKDFLTSPVESVYDFKRKQAEREIVEVVINSAVVDLRTETIRTGSPYTLRIIKTQDSYHRQMKEWKEDIALLEQMEAGSHIDPISE